MRIAAITCLLLLGPAAHGQSAETEKERKQLSALVEASRKAKSEVKPKPVARITDANLKKAPPRKPAPKVDPATVVKEQIEVIAPTLGAEAAAVLAAEKQVRELEKELLRLEQAYYDESDPSHREKVVRKRFEATKKRLDEARDKLASMRVAEDASETPSEPE